ncbi:hypothetical protein IQ22_00595 [Pseudomonas duriflava]|uniref:Uncharacterized protein n=1 Tax=Pseudomonas duriflava TaxID=459528 RepID=A0A562QKY8_9PSED|nr:hypothetical protein [Pseudomonas duriflava]TWI57379.1 hypothetical protein IQ22_00595 [Pseudomonas duriflava]
MNRMNVLPLTTLTLSLFSGLALAGQDSGPPPGPHTPPPFVFKACEGHHAGDTVSFKAPDGKMLSGVCKDLDGKLAALPDHPPREKHDGPPPEK